MTARGTSIWHRTGPAAAIGVLLIASAAHQGCSDDPNPSASTSSSTTTTSDATTTTSSGTGGAGGMGQGGAGGSSGLALNAAANDAAQFTSPFDATPDATGQNVYFTAINLQDEPAVFTAPAAGGPPTQLVAGLPLVAPISIATAVEGGQLYVADPAAEDANYAPGAIFELAATGGAVSVVAGSEGLTPRGLEVHKDNVTNQQDIWFTGVDALSGSPGLFKLPVGGGAVTTVAMGAPFSDPSGVAITAAGEAYVADTDASGTYLGAILQVKGGAATVLVSDLGVGYPAGVALTMDEATLIVSGLDADTRHDVVYLIDLATKAVTRFNQGIDTFREAAGLHRAKNADVFAWADSQAQVSGTVYVLK